MSITLRSRKSVKILAAAASVLSLVAGTAVATAADASPKLVASVVDSDIVVVSGSHFTNGSSIALRAVVKGGSGQTTLKANASGRFLMGFSVPEGFAGAVDITATGTSQTAKASVKIGSGDSAPTTKAPSTSTAPTTTAPTTTTKAPSTPTTPTTVRATTTTVKAPSNGAAPIPALAGNNWKLSFAEEFNGTDYDHKKLTPCFDWNYGGCTKTFNEGREIYKPSQVRVGGGTAKLVAEPLKPAEDTGCFMGPCTYKSGLLSTARPNAGDGSDYLYKFTYGYVESRMKFPAKQGFFTAFWMLPAEKSFNYKTEIDILEQLGHDPTSMFMNYHYGDRSKSFTKNSNPNKNGACADKNYGTDFHTIGLDWQKDHIAWYIDGVKCQEFTSAGDIESGPMQIIIDLMVDHKWQRDWKKPLLDTNATAQLELDYLRVYQHA